VVTLPRRGEIWWAELEDAGRRPYLVLTRDAAIPVLNRVLAAPLTRTVRGIPTEVPLGPADGLPVECAASFDNLTTVPRSHLVERITRLPPAVLAEVCAALRAATAC
jgi:mRNA interferase MazF